MKYLTIDTQVCIRSIVPESIEWHGKTGTLSHIDMHANDGDAFGVMFEGEPDRTVYFWRNELEAIEQEEQQQHV